MIVSNLSNAAGAGPSDREAVVRKASFKLEAQFLSEMLKHAGFGESNSAFGGGIGEEQFASFLREGQAERMAAAGGVGLAESIYQALMARSS